MNSSELTEPENGGFFSSRSSQLHSLQFERIMPSYTSICQESSTGQQIKYKILLFVCCCNLLISPKST